MIFSSVYLTYCWCQPETCLLSKWTGAGLVPKMRQMPEIKWRQQSWEINWYEDIRNRFRTFLGLFERAYNVSRFPTFFRAQVKSTVSWSLQLSGSDLSIKHLFAPSVTSRVHQNSISLGSCFWFLSQSSEFTKVEVRTSFMTFHWLVHVESATYFLHSYTLFQMLGVPKSFRRVEKSPASSVRQHDPLQTSESEAFTIIGPF